MKRPGQYLKIVQSFKFSAPRVSKAKIYVLECKHAVMGHGKIKGQRMWCAICTKKQSGTKPLTKTEIKLRREVDRLKDQLAKSKSHLRAV